MALIVLLRVLCRQRIWLFTSWEGKIFGDNPKHFFKFMLRQTSGIKCIWVAKDLDLVRSLRKRGYHAVLKESFLGQAYASLAEACFYSDSLEFSRYLNPSAVRVNLWHGIGMKNIGYIKSEFDFISVTSEESRKIFTGIFSCDPSKVIITGQPKNDVLFSIPSSRSVMFDRWGASVRIVAYMPTYRGSFKEKKPETRDNRSGCLISSCLFGQLRQKFENILAEHNLIFVIKPHLRNKLANPNLERVLILDEYASLPEGCDSHELMSISDVLITDYSSVSFDFYLTERPFILYAPDLDEYLREQNLYYDIRKLAAGYLANDEETLLNYLTEIVKKPEKNLVLRRELKAQFHTFQDGKSSERILCEVNRHIALKKMRRGTKD
jgi:CDP-glycerol glycerophosphotransferase (TagB/SpsB family)